MTSQDVSLFGSSSLTLSPSLQAPMAALAQAVLAEVPNQVVSYFKMRGLEPTKTNAATKS